MNVMKNTDYGGSARCFMIDGRNFQEWYRYLHHKFQKKEIEKVDIK